MFFFFHLPMPCCHPVISFRSRIGSTLCFLVYTVDYHGSVCWQIAYEKLTSSRRFLCVFQRFALSTETIDVLLVLLLLWHSVGTMVAETQDILEGSKLVAECFNKFCAYFGGNAQFPGLVFCPGH